ncbi:MAG: hypothetical protein DI539_29980 [Flavobacterium psychrophilum]|nr:MAG: hypothetical protein DI539_29980 [Flavobacterium psychrophilum]
MSDPVYFTRLEIENVRCFGPETTLDLSDGKGNWKKWTVILGDNGTGKSTLLQILAASEIEIIKDYGDPRYAFLLSNRIRTVFKL